MNTAEIAAYDQFKSSIVAKYPHINPDKKSLHLFCGALAGFVAVCCGSPMDVMKTRIMNVIVS